MNKKMPLTQRSSANMGRRAEQPVAQEIEQALRDALNTAHTELDKANADRDRFRTECERFKTLLAESRAALAEAKTQVVGKDEGGYKEKYRQLKADLEATKTESATDYAALKKDYSDLHHDYDQLSVQHKDLASKASSATSSPTLADRTKVPSATSSSSKKDGERREREERDRDRARGRDREREKERERDTRRAEKEVEREREARRAEKEREKDVEKERLSKRFDNHNRPPISSSNSHRRRESFIEPFGPSGRSPSQKPTQRPRSGTATRTQPPTLPPQQGYAHPSVPRTPNPLSPGVYSHSSGSSAVYDDEAYDDGNYHAFPVQR